jgi:hypothetical protein
MANTLRHNVWVCDTAGVLSTKPTKVKLVRWVSKTSTAGDDVSVEDGDGGVVFATVASTTNYYVEGQSFGEDGFWFQGLEIAVIDSGTVYIYLA